MSHLRLPAIVARMRDWLPRHWLGYGGALLWLLALAAGVLAWQFGSLKPPTGSGEANLAELRAAEIGTLLNQFLPVAAREQQIAALLQAADDAGLEVGGGRYEQQPTSDGNLERIRISLPISGESLALLHWVDALSDTFASATIERVSLTRADAEAPLAGEVQLDLYLGAAP